jgi:hypothetical protein
MEPGLALVLAGLVVAVLAARKQAEGAPVTVPVPVEEPPGPESPR